MENKLIQRSPSRMRSVSPGIKPVKIFLSQYILILLLQMLQLTEKEPEEGKRIVHRAFNIMRFGYS